MKGHFRIVKILNIFFFLVTIGFATEIHNIFENSHSFNFSIDIPEPSKSYLDINTNNEIVPHWSDVSWAVFNDNHILPYFTIPIVLPSINADIDIQFVIKSMDDFQFQEPHILDIHKESLEHIDLSSQIQVQMGNRGYANNIPIGTIVIIPTVENRQAIQSLDITIDFKGVMKGNNQLSLPPFINSNQAKNWDIETFHFMSSLHKTTDIPGRWFRFNVTNGGIFKITPNSFPSGTNLTDPGSWELYTPSFQGREMPLILLDDSAEPDNLSQMSMDGLGVSDGVFSGNDYFRFYARGINGEIENNFQTHSYANSMTYWLFLPDDETTIGNRIQSIQSLNIVADETISTMTSAYYHENEINNILHSGKSWVGEQFNGPSDNLYFYLDLPVVTSSGTCTISAKLNGTLDYTTSYVHYFDVIVNNIDLHASQNTRSNTANIMLSSTGNLFQKGGNTLQFKYQSSSSAAAYLDWFKITYPREIESSNEPIYGWLTLNANSTQLSALALSSNWHFWDFNNYLDPEALVFTGNNFKTQKQGNVHLLGFADGMEDAISLELVDIDFNRLRNPSNEGQYVIISPETFISQAERLADIHENKVRLDEQLKCYTASISDIYNEFSGGVDDPGAIKYFLSYALRNWAIKPEYVVLLGDADFDYRNLTGLSQLRIPTIQVDGLTEINSYSSDDFFTHLIGNDVLPDIALGRIPAKNASKLNVFLDKLEQYCVNSPEGLWRNTITLVADDPLRPREYFESYHIDDTEDLADQLPKSLQVNKVYLTEYPEVQDPTSPYVLKPAARDALLQRIYNGTAIVNYMGHGSPWVWAQEEVFTESDLSNLRTHGQWPLFCAGTCDWGKYDDVASQSMAEHLLLLENEGGIGVIASTRKSFGGSNAALFSKFYTYLFPNNNSSYSIPIGKAMQLTKIARSSGGASPNDLKYVILSDPALRIPTPKYSSDFTQINPLKPSAMETFSYEGQAPSDLMNDGFALVTAFDSPRRVTRHIEWQTATGSFENNISYYLPGRRIFRGSISYTNSIFSGQFIIPKDINYSGNKGKINVQFWDADKASGIATIDTLEFQGGDSTTLNQQGPEIIFVQGDLPLMQGDELSANEEFFIELTDEQGINLTGAAGHGIILSIDDNLSNSTDITELFQYNLDDSKSGKISLILPDIEPGRHKLSLEAWDNHNNPSNENIELNFFASDKFVVFDVYNFPNPMSDDTQFTFRLSHSSDVFIHIFSLSGRKITTLEAGYLSTGFHTTYWNGEDDYANKLANGVYLYQVHAESDAFEEPSDVIQKLVMSR
jgi:hypothetical protein